MTDNSFTFEVEVFTVLDNLLDDDLFDAGERDLHAFIVTSSVFEHVKEEATHVHDSRVYFHWVTLLRN